MRLLNFHTFFRLWALGLVPALILLTDAARLSAQEAEAPAPTPEPVIAVLDMQQVMREANAVLWLQNEIDRRRTAYQENLVQQEAQIREAETELVQARESMTPEDFAVARRELEEKVIAIQQRIQQDRQLLETSFTEGMRMIQKVALDVTAGLVEERDLTLIVTKNSVVLSDPAYEITSEVLTRTNAQISTVPLPEFETIPLEPKN